MIQSNHQALLELPPDCSLASRRDALREVGYCIVRNVLDRDEVAELRQALAPHFQHTGRNDFEGFASNRVYSLLAKAPAPFARLVSHPLALDLAEAELGASCLLSACLAINLLPGETAQPWHHDDAQIDIPLPRPSYGVSAFWALDDLTEHNGATEFFPGSHLWHSDQRGDADQSAVKAVMPAGSLMLTTGTLLHRGGANNSESPRLIVTPQYCPGWARQIENMMAAVSADIAQQLPERVQALLGYSTHAAFMGYVDGRHPGKLLSTR